MRALLSALCLALCLAGQAAPAAAKRVALVIGNDAYKSLPPLQKAVNDARAVAATLEGIGFKVLIGENLTRRATNRKLADFEAAIAPGDQAFFFFAGHGVALGAENYLIPSDMPKPRAGEDGLVRDEAHGVNALIARVRGRGAASSFFVLDACRDNPFAATGVRSIGGTRGLTRVEAPSGVFVLFSAGIGQKALDRLSDGDTNPNSVFTRKLMPLLRTPGLSHVRLAKRVQQEVSALAGTVRHLQEPAYYDQIIGEIVLRPGAPESPGRPSARPAGPRLDAAAQVWRAIAGTESPAVLKAFIEQFPKSVFATFARARLDELEGGPPSRPSQQGSVSPAREPPPSDPDTQQTQGRWADQKALVRAIQTALNQHGCDAGAVDGAWGARSRDAVAAFARYTKQSLDPVPSKALLDALEARKPRACPAAPREASPRTEAPGRPDPRPASKVFQNPKIAGMPVDICVASFQRCNGEAAREFCRRAGYRTATKSQTAIYPATRHIGSGGVCKPRGLVLCGGYSMIVCAR